MIFGHDFQYYQETFGEIGFVESTRHPLLNVSGLPGAFIDEVILFENNDIGVVTALNNAMLEVSSFGVLPISLKTKAVRTGSRIKFPVGDSMLGKVLSPLGHSKYAEDPFHNVQEYVDIYTEIKTIKNRKKITEPYYTGVSIVDLLLPLGKGQRELVIGDKQTGKTSFLTQICNSQYKNNNITVYCCIGKTKADIKKIESNIAAYGLKDKLVMIVAESSDPIGTIIISPFTAMAVAEWFMNKGKDVTVIFDDLTSHGKYYRELSLLGNRFPGRSSYPGDIFNIHAKLLERGGCFTINSTAASITCLPVADTVENDISGYIQTNLMSITDGHIFLDKDLFTKGRRPPVNYFLSVTRVGRQTQNTLRWSISRELLSFLTLYEKVKGFVQFGAELNEGTQSTIQMGERIETIFNQDLDEILPISLQILIFTIVWIGKWDNESMASIRVKQKKMIHMYFNDSSYAGTVDSIVYNSNDLNQLLMMVNQNIDSILKYV